MILASHNSLTYLPVKKWWMKLIRFTAKCQNLTIEQQYNYGVRGFDFRVRFDKNLNFIVAHGLVQYDISLGKFVEILDYLESKSTKKNPIYIRIINEVRNQKQKDCTNTDAFISFCKGLECSYPKIKFYCGMDLLSPPNVDYDFNCHPTVEENYASVMPPYKWDDWFPYIYAKKHNKEIKERGTDKDMLMIDFVEIE